MVPRGIPVLRERETALGLVVGSTILVGWLYRLEYVLQIYSGTPL